MLVNIVRVLMIVFCVACIYSQDEVRSAELQKEAQLIEDSCARDFSINSRLRKNIHSPIKLTVMHNPKNNVQCFARCMVDRFGYYQYTNGEFDVERLVEVALILGQSENRTRHNAERCRIAWQGVEDCEDFWNIYKCLHGSV